MLQTMTKPAFDKSRKALRTFGERHADARERAGLTQNDVAKQVGISRSAVTQWESGTTSPSLQRIQEAADVLEVSAEFLAYGIGDGEGVGNAHLIPEIQFGLAETDQKIVDNWSFPESALQDFVSNRDKKIVIWQTESDNLSPTVRPGDRILLDLNDKRPSNGTFVVWLGENADIYKLSVRPAASPGTGLTVRAFFGDGSLAFEGHTSKIKIVGRVKGAIKTI